MTVAEEFATGKHGLGHVHAFLVGELGGLPYEPTDRLLTHTDTDEKMFDGDIEESINPGKSSFGDIIHALDSDLLIKDGSWNVFYVEGHAVSLCFLEESGWRANAWELNGSPWSAGSHIWFPKTQ